MFIGALPRTMLWELTGHSDSDEEEARSPLPENPLHSHSRPFGSRATALRLRMSPPSVTTTYGCKVAPTCALGHGICWPCVLSLCLSDTSWSFVKNG